MGIGDIFWIYFVLMSLQPVISQRLASAPHVPFSQLPDSAAAVRGYRCLNSGFYKQAVSVRASWAALRQA
jgi:hypothetical protein